MTVTILDTQTGEKRSSDRFPSANEWWWSEGNGACDCNRRLLFIKDDDPDEGCFGNKRYLIVATSDPSVSLRYLNQDYPEELLHQYLSDA